MISAGIITISDRASSGIYKDLSGPKIRKILEGGKLSIKKYEVIADEEKKIIQRIKHMTDELNINIVLTTGGTGIGLRDVTAKATRKIIDKELPGISEFIRFKSLKYNRNAMLSCLVSGIRKKSIIINLPGNPKAIEQIMPLILPVLIHGIELINNNARH
ncbi:MAG: MogA/MoaB family molybdenum cofactor biosynthesis protein [Candidatus Omnitrophota bacterium]